MEGLISEAVLAQPTAPDDVLTFDAVRCSIPLPRLYLGVEPSNIHRFAR